MKSKPSEKLLEVAQEITFAKALASNDKTIRDRALKRIRRWISSKVEASAEFTEDRFLRLWRGLYYNIWMSDKPLVQEEVVEGISNLVHCFKKYPDVIRFIKGFFQIISQNWLGLDVHRIDKYLMFIRRFIRQTLKVLENYDWNKQQILEFTSMLTEAFSKAPLGFFMHICEVYLEELAKVSRGSVSKEVVAELIKPFGETMSLSSDKRLIKHVGDHIYLYLMKQSDLGIKHDIKFEQWRKLGCPEGNINVMKEIRTNSDEEEEFNEDEEMGDTLDPRAGHVDVLLPTLKFDVQLITKHLTELKKNGSTTTCARKLINDLLNKYKTFAKGKYPLGIHKVDLPEYEDEEELIENAAQELLEEEIELNSEDMIPSSKRMRKKMARAKSEKRDWTVVTAAEMDSYSKSKNESDLNNSNHSQWEESDIADSFSGVNKTCSPDSSNKKQQKSRTLTNGSTNSGKKIEEQNNQTPKQNGRPKKKLKKEINDWGEVSWDDENQETEIKIDPDRKRRHSDIGPLSRVKSLANDKNNLSLNEGRSGKRVEFVLNRNSFQDEEDYLRSLKENPKIKFNGEVPPPTSVLKITPFSSPVNPFKLSK